MGSIIFLCFICIMFVSGVVCLALSVRYKIPLFLKSVFVFMIIMPVIFLMVIRFSNEQNEEDYQDTGIMIKWAKKDEEFVYKDKRYYQVKDMNILGESDADWCVKAGSGKELVFNIEPKKSFMDHIFGSNEKEEVYLVKNALNLTLYEAYGLYAEKNALQTIKSYYEDGANYNFYLHDDEDWEWTPQTKEMIDLSSKEWMKICRLSKHKQTDLILNEKMAKEVNRNLFDVSGLSKDKVILVNGPVVFRYKNDWYVYGEPKETKNDLMETAAKLPEKIADKLSGK